MNVTITDILLARKRIEAFIEETPFIKSAPLSETVGAEVYVKLENLQVTGSFKARGALNKILSLTDVERTRGIITASAGNHAQGVCYAASLTGISALIVVPVTAPQTKKDGIRRLGGELIEFGANYDEAEAHAFELCKSTGRVFVHGFEDELIIAGQGTVGLEMLMDQPDLDVLVIPAGGGGLMCGIGAAARALCPQTRVVGVQSTASPPWYYSFQAGHLVDVEYQATLADGLLGDIGKGNLDMALRVVDEIVLVEESDIADAMRYMASAHHQIIEGSAAVSVAALLTGAVKDFAGQKVGVIISGGNVDSSKLAKIILDTDTPYGI